MSQVMRSLYAVFLCLLLALPAAAGDKPPEAFGEVTFETPEGGAYAQEMITMVVRFYFKTRATTEAMEQPKLDELGWTQLGRDTWAPTKIGTVNWFSVERRIAVFAPEARTYTIPPFVHHVTLIDAEDKRWKVDAVSKPVELTIRPWTGKTDGPQDEDTWWLPARSVEVKDEWSIDPSTLAAGETSRRRLEVTAVGVPAEQLPPAIETQSPGLIVFAGPVERRTEIVDGVPVGHAVYSYDIRPHTGDPTILREVLLPWFDTEARQMRQAIVPGANVGQGMVIPGQPLSDASVADNGAPKLYAGLAAGAIAFVLGVAALLLPGREDREPFAARLRETVGEIRRTLAVRAAAWRGRAEELRGAIYVLAREDGALGGQWLGQEDVRRALASLDGALFGQGGDVGGVDLRTIAGTVLAARAAALRARPRRIEVANEQLSPFGN